MSFKYMASPKSLETTYTSHYAKWNGWEKVAGGIMLNLITNDSRVIEENGVGSRVDNFAQLRETINYAKMVLECNEDKPALFVTLTYKTKKGEPMNDTKKLYADQKQFFKNLKRAGIDDVQYFIAREPQKNGSWHMHCILYSPTLYNMFFACGTYEKKYKGGKSIPRTKNGLLVRLLCKCWHFANPAKQGVDITCPRSVTAYLTTYLTKNIYKGEGKKKQMLYLYPKGFRPFVWSRMADIGEFSNDKLLRPLTGNTEGIGAFMNDFVNVRNHSKIVELEGQKMKIVYSQYVNKKLLDKDLPINSNKYNLGSKVADNAGYCNPTSDYLNEEFDYEEFIKGNPEYKI